MWVTLPKDAKDDLFFCWRGWLGFVCLMVWVFFEASVPELIDTHHFPSAVDEFPSSAP